MSGKKNQFDAEWFGVCVKEWRGDRSLRDVAKELQTSASTLSRVECGRHKLRVLLFMRLCHWMQADPLDFFDAARGDDPA
jgi:transcriptional regulator with XRE-family HTH domain